MVSPSGTPGVVSDTGGSRDCTGGVPWGFTGVCSQSLSGLSTAVIPLLTTGADTTASSTRTTVSAVGMRLTGLSIVKGTTRRNATNPHSTQVIQRGAFRRHRRSSSTASTIHPAITLRLKICRNIEVIICSPFLRSHTTSLWCNPTLSLIKILSCAYDGAGTLIAVRCRSYRGYPKNNHTAYQQQSNSKKRSYRTRRCSRRRIVYLRCSPRNFDTAVR